MSSGPGALPAHGERAAGAAAGDVHDGGQVPRAQDVGHGVRNVCFAFKDAHLGVFGARFFGEACGEIVQRGRDIGRGVFRVRDAPGADGGEDGVAAGHLRARHCSWNVLPSGAGKSRTANQFCISGKERTVPPREIAFSSRVISFVPDDRGPGASP